MRALAPPYSRLMGQWVAESVPKSASGESLLENVIESGFSVDHGDEAMTAVDAGPFEVPDHAYSVLEVAVAARVVVVVRVVEVVEDMRPEPVGKVMAPYGVVAAVRVLLVGGRYNPDVQEVEDTGPNHIP